MGGNRKFIHFAVEKGPNFATTITKLETDLTSEMMTRFVPLLFPLIFLRSRSSSVQSEGGLTSSLVVVWRRSGAWRNASFKKYNFAAAGVPTDGGSLHPLLKVREEFRNIFFEMG